MSYELRTPLNTIIGTSKLLSTGFFGELEERQGECVRGIFDSSQHLLQLVKSFVDLHGGRLDVESSSESGTLITCVLPVSAHRAN